MSNLCVTPVHAAVSSLVYSQRGDEVDRVYVDGRLVVDGGVLVTVDQDEVGPVPPRRPPAWQRGPEPTGSPTAEWRSMVGA